VILNCGHRWSISTNVTRVDSPIAGDSGESPAPMTLRRPHGLPLVSAQSGLVGTTEFSVAVIEVMPAIAERARGVRRARALRVTAEIHPLHQPSAARDSMICSARACRGAALAEPSSAKLPCSRIRRSQVFSGGQSGEQSAPWRRSINH
jgi:hypothetical protein